MPTQDHYPLKAGEKLKVGFSLRAADLLVLIGTAYLAAFIRVPGIDISVLLDHTVMITVVTTMVMLELQGVYRFPTSVDPNLQTGALLKGISIALILSMLWVLGTQAGGEISRLFAGMWAVFAAIGIVVIRAIHFRVYSFMIGRAEVPAHMLVYVRDKAAAQDFLSRMKLTDAMGEIFGIYCDEPELMPDGAAAAGGFEAMMAAGRSGGPDKVIYCGPLGDRHEKADLFRRMEELPADIMINPGGDFAAANVIDFAHMKGLLLARVVEKPFGEAGGYLKIWEDRLLVLPILAIVGPFMLLIALLIKLDSRGPVFFRQERLGLNNEVFRVWKFRTMVVHDEKQNATQATKNDPRVTRIGRWLRASSIDELPQLFNVFNGEMSLVGPRPLPLWLNEEYSKIASGFFIRHKVRPGMTGWAQVNGLRGEITNDQMLLDRLRYDLEYIENWSLFFDIRIFLLTVITGFINKNAY